MLKLSTRVPILGSLGKRVKHIGKSLNQARQQITHPLSTPPGTRVRSRQSGQRYSAGAPRRY